MGENIIKLHVPGGAERPCDIPELDNRDTRELSVAVQNVTFVGRVSLGTKTPVCYEHETGYDRPAVKGLNEQMLSCREGDSYQ